MSDIKQGTASVPETENHSKLYPLTAGQMWQQIPIDEYGTQQTANLCVLAALQSPLDFDLLRKCIAMEYERCECLRVRFTEPDADGKVFQYIQPEIPEIPYEDLSGMTWEEARENIQQRAYKPFVGHDVPMSEIIMLSLPDEYNGIYMHIDHRLLDSCGMSVMVNDLMELYCHYRFGSPMPQDLSSYSEMLEKDLQRAENPKRVERDRSFWQERFDTLGEPLYADVKGQKVLQECRRKHNNKALRAADHEAESLFANAAFFHLEPAAARKLIEFCINHQISMTNLLLLGIRTTLSKDNGGQEDITVRNYINRRSTQQEWTSGGSRTIAYPCRTIISPDTEFLDAAYEVQNVQNQVYRHSNYDPVLLIKQMQDTFGTPEHAGYEGFALTYQPITVKFSNPHLQDIPVRSVWFTNGAAIQKAYLTVTHTNDNGMDFNFRYHVRTLEREDMERFYYYMMKVLFKGIEDPEMTIGEIISTI